MAEPYEATRCSHIHGPMSKRTSELLPPTPRRMSQRKWISSAALVTIALAAACSDSTTQPGTGNLSTEQLQSMTTALSSLLALSLGTLESNRVAASRFNDRRVNADVAIGGSVVCAKGGRVGSTGVFSNDTAGNGIFALTDTLVACAVEDNHSNTWTFTSKPTLNVTLVDSTNIHGDSIDLSHTAISQTDVGKLQYSSGTVSGTCSIDMSIEYVVDAGVPTADSATLSLHSQGTVCNQSVSRDTSSTFPYTPPHF